MSTSCHKGHSSRVTAEVVNGHGRTTDGTSGADSITQTGWRTTCLSLSSCLTVRDQKGAHNAHRACRVRNRRSS
jgi:hypothetical protein